MAAGGRGRFSNVIDDSRPPPVLHESRQRLDHDGKAIKRNMLMNIILRPGGGNKNKALPRPKVDVKAEGANVIVIKMTFPDNENIQGLRAFTPTDPRELDQGRILQWTFQTFSLFPYGIVLDEIP